MRPSREGKPPNRLQPAHRQACLRGGRLSVHPRVVPNPRGLAGVPLKRGVRRRDIRTVRPPMLLFVLVILTAMAPPAVDSAQPSPSSAQEPEAEEYEVMAAVLSAAYSPNSTGWVMLAARTATFECNPSAPIGFDNGGCSGMRDESMSPEEVLVAVREAIPGVSAELAADLLGKSHRSVTLSRTLGVPIPQALYAPDRPSEKKYGGSPAFAAYFSRVGFDTRRLKALVYLGTVNWTDQAKSVGQYLYLEKHDRIWAVKDHLKIWDFGVGPPPHRDRVTRQAPTN